MTHSYVQNSAEDRFSWIKCFMMYRMEAAVSDVACCPGGGGGRGTSTSFVRVCVATGLEN